MKHSSAQRQIPLERMGPHVDLAGCWRFREPMHIRYHALFHHFILVEQGGVETRTPVREFKARAGDLLCLRPVEWSEYRTLANTIMYQITVAFAPAPFELATPLLPGLGVLPVHVRLGKFVDPVRRAFETICVELPQASLRSQLRWKAAIYQLLEAVAAALTGNVEEHRQVDQWEAVRFKLTSVDGSKADIAGLARDMGYRVVEVPVNWDYSGHSTVRLFSSGGRMLFDLFRLALRRVLFGKFKA